MEPVGEIALQTSGLASIVVLTGEVDLDTVMRFRARRQPVGTVDAIDASGVTFLDSSGLKFLLELRSLNPDIRLIDPAPALLELLEMTNTAALFHGPSDDGSGRPDPLAP